MGGYLAALDRMKKKKKFEQDKIERGFTLKNAKIFQNLKHLKNPLQQRC